MEVSSQELVLLPPTGDRLRYALIFKFVVFALQFSKFIYNTNILSYSLSFYL